PALCVVCDALTRPRTSAGSAQRRLVCTGWPVVPLPSGNRDVPQGSVASGNRNTAGARGSAMPQWTLFENDFRLIDGVLDDLLQRTNALSAHLIDRSGQVITSAGRVDDFDVTSFASLAAADFTANAELAQLMGEPSVDAVVNEGRLRSVYSRLLAGRVIM